MLETLPTEDVSSFLPTTGLRRRGCDCQIGSAVHIDLSGVPSGQAPGGHTQLPGAFSLCEWGARLSGKGIRVGHSFTISCTPTWNELLSAKMQMCSIVTKEIAVKWTQAIDQPACGLWQKSSSSER